MDTFHAFNNAALPEHFRARLVIEADFDPQFPARVLHRFSERGTLPLGFQFTADEAQGVRVEIEFESTIEAARLLSRRLMNLPSAHTVDLSFRRQTVRIAEPVSRKAA